MYHQGRPIDEPEGEEVMVYDWNNRAGPVPAGTSRLLNIPSNTLPKPMSSLGPSSNPTHFEGGGVMSAYYNHSNNHLNGYYQHQNSVGYAPSHQYSVYPHPPPRHNFPSNPTYGNLNSYPGSAIIRYGPPPSPSAFTNFGLPQQTTRQNTSDDDWSDIEEFDYSKGSRGRVKETKTKDKSRNRRPPPPPTLHSPSNNLMEVEEIDYSDYSRRLSSETEKPSQSNCSDNTNNANSEKCATASATQKNAGNSVAEIEETDYRKSKPAESAKVDAQKLSVDKSLSTISVPKPDLPLTDVLPELPNKFKGVGHASIRNARKRPRSVLEKSDSSDLEDLLSKTKHRVSARSYAKPTRRASSGMNHTNVVSDDGTQSPVTRTTTRTNDEEFTTASDTATTNANEEDSVEPMRPDIHEQNEAALNKSMEDSDYAEQNSESECEEHEEVQLRIRTDIFDEGDNEND